jgi:hypothetical protein
MAGDGRVAAGGSPIGTGSGQSGSKANGSDPNDNDPNDADGQFDSQDMPTTDGQMASNTSEEVVPPRADSSGGESGTGN